MKSGKFSHMAMMIGLLLGVVAVWASATPVAGDGDRVVGGWWYWS